MATAKLLLDHDALLYTGSRRPWEDWSSFDETPLAAAANRDDVSAVAFLLSSGAYAVDSEALQHAVLNRNEEMIQLILFYFRNTHPQGHCLIGLDTMSAAVSLGDGLSVCHLLAAGIRIPRLWWTCSDEEASRSPVHRWKTPLYDTICTGGEESIAMMRALLDDAGDGADLEAIVYRSCHPQSL